MRALISALLLAISASASAGATIPARAPDTTLEGRLDEGTVIDNGWASASNVACFPGNMNSYFSGRQVPFVLAQSPSKDLVIRVTPAEGVDVSVVALQLGPTQQGKRPPNLDSAWRCTPAYAHKGAAAEALRLTGTNSPLEVVLLVVGADGRESGAFKVEVWEEAGRFSP